MSNKELPESSRATLAALGIIEDHQKEVAVLQNVNDVAPPEQLPLDRMFPVISPPGYSGVNPETEFGGGIPGNSVKAGLDPDRVFLPSFNDPSVLCGRCKYALVITSIQPGNRKVDGTPFTRAVGYCAYSRQNLIELDDFRPIKCSKFKPDRKNKED